ncbi:MAG: hypothetical protein GXP33_01300 [Spirochaetes bacterium]|nr:hypothetical protein [Spirochaetota bacterium]
MKKNLTILLLIIISAAGVYCAAGTGKPVTPGENSDVDVIMVFFTRMFLNKNE